MLQLTPTVAEAKTRRPVGSPGLVPSLLPSGGIQLQLWDNYSRKTCRTSQNNRKSLGDGKRSNPLRFLVCSLNVLYIFIW